MAVDSKYYTPDIEEFHVGFEYEFCDFLSEKPSEWYKRKFGILDNPIYLESASWLFNLESEVNKGNVRVKYLDKKDIESLGFKDDGKTVDDWFILEKRIRLSSGHYFEKFRLQHDRDNSFQVEEDHKYNVKIYGVMWGEDEVLFEGIIRNKSELKRLLKQLGIDEA